MEPFAENSGLADYYKAVSVQICDEPLSPDLQIARWLAEEERRQGKRPTVIFRNAVGYPGVPLLGNPYPRQVIFAALKTDEMNWQSTMAQRLQNTVPGLEYSSQTWQSMAGLDALPVLQHRPGDAGRYITSGVTVTRAPDTGYINLGVYRIQVVSSHHARIFFDPRTDAYRNWQVSIKSGQALPVAIFIGANPVHMLVAASRLPALENDFSIVSQLLDRKVQLVGEDLPVPLDSSYVILGEVTDKLETEGPFAEFKGYYVDARQSPVLNVQAVLCASRPIYPIIVTGAESGLTLMALQNEYLLYSHLISKNFLVKRVRYLLEGRGEFVTLLETNQPSLEMIKAAMAFDTRTKLVACGPQLEHPWDAIASYGFQVHHEPYFRKGKQEGQRVGLLLEQPPVGHPVEY